MAILNIGLLRSESCELAPNAPLNVSLVMDLLFSIWGRGVVATVAMSNSEPTLVVDTRGRKVRPFTIRLLCEVLTQDAIAWLDEDGRGHLEGPKASLWGPFNPDFFLLQDGSRLGQPLAA